MPTVDELLSDLAAENASLDDVVAGIDDDTWSTPTPAVGWDVRDSVSHLCFFDHAATLAVEDGPGFEAWWARLGSTGPPPTWPWGGRSSRLTCSVAGATAATGTSRRPGRPKAMRISAGGGQPGQAGSDHEDRPWECFRFQRTWSFFL